MSSVTLGDVLGVFGGPEKSNLAEYGTPEITDINMTMKTLVTLFNSTLIKTANDLHKFFVVLGLYIERKNEFYAQKISDQIKQSHDAFKNPPQFLTECGVRFYYEGGEFFVSQTKINAINKFVIEKHHREPGEPLIKDQNIMAIVNYVNFVNENRWMFYATNSIDSYRPACMTSNGLNIVGEFTPTVCTFNEAEILSNEEFDIETRKLIIEKAHAHLQYINELSDVPTNEPLEIARHYDDVDYAVLFKIKSVLTMLSEQKMYENVSFTVSDTTFSENPERGKIARVCFFGFFIKCIMPLTQMKYSVTEDTTTTPSTYRFIVGKYVGTNVHGALGAVAPAPAPYVPAPAPYVPAPAPPVVAPAGAAGGGGYMPPAGAASRFPTHPRVRRGRTLRSEWSDDEFESSYGANDRGGSGFDNYDYLA
jgi:hypothetical protein